MKILKIHSLNGTWHDKDVVMLHATFQLLVDFIEQEKPGRIVDWDADPVHRKAWKEIRWLYKWWTETRPARRDPLARKGMKKPRMHWKKIPGSDCAELVSYDKKVYVEYHRALTKYGRLKKKWEDEDQRSLHRLIEVRGFLWT